MGARYLRHGDAIWELPTTRNVEGMLNEQGMKDAKPVVTPAVARNDDDDDEVASAEEHGFFDALWARVSSCFPASQTLHLPRKAWRGPWQNLQKSDLITSKRHLRYLCGTMDFGLKLHVQNRARSTLTMFNDIDWAGSRHIRKSVSSWVVMLDGLLLSAGARTQSVIAQSSCEAERSTSRLRSWLVDNTWTSICVPTALAPLVWQAEEV